VGRGRVYFFSDSLDGGPVGDAVFCENRNAAAPATMKKTTMATIIDKFTFVVRRCTFTSGNPLLSLSIDI
jgi:hypothetical protein